MILTIHVQDTDVKNDTTLMKEFKNLKKCKDILCSWTGRLMLMSILLIMIYRFSTIPFKHP